MSIDQTILEAVQKELGDRGIASFYTATKMNQPALHGIMITFENVQTAPVIYLDEYVGRYLRMEPADLIAKEIVKHAQTLIEQIDASYRASVEGFKDFEKVRSHLSCRLINYDLNEQLLKDVPHKRFLDLAVVYYYSVGEGQSIMIHNKHLTQWGISEQQLEESVPKQSYNALNMNTLLTKMTGKNYSSEVTSKMYILTTDSMMYGATAMLDNEFLAGVARIFKDQTFYILPSSVHELIACPTEDVCNSEMLAEIVSDINGTTVDQEDFLSDSVYIYEKGRVTYAD